ncbi:MAG: beta-N-acetylhexosaminidase [Bacteriovoracaceae bacterium]|nr:beta-N-acetylhexosaminidase [Bacteriovoracaceae bacterium]
MNNEVGQLIITGIEGFVLNDMERDFIEKENIGGVILFSRNFESPAQLAELINSIQKLRQEYPLFISVDHEGGRVIRFRKNFTQFPAMAEIAKLDSPKMCFHIHKIMAEELAVCGINLDFSPCCDVLSNSKNKVIGDRSFGTMPDDVSKYITAAIRGLQTNGVLACAKHFPGHGATSKDSHLELPIVNISKEELDSKHLPPFVRAIKSSRVEFVMMAHVIVDCLDPELPSSLSLKVHNLLRKDMKFNKIIVSDDMQMQAISDNYSVEESVSLALKAGTDVLIYRDASKAQEALAVIKNSMKTKKIKNELIMEKLGRINKCKKAYIGEYKPVYIPKISNKINSRSTQIFLDEILEKIESKR